MTIPNGIDIGGLDEEDRARIVVIGLWKWMDEVATKQGLDSRRETQAAKQVAQSYTKTRACGVCGKKFKFFRADAIYCSQRCQKRRTRNGLNVRIKASGDTAKSIT